MTSGRPNPPRSFAAGMRAWSWYSCAGGPARTAQGSACNQLPLRGPALPERPLSDPGLALLRVTGTKSPKSKWKFTKAGEDRFCFAGLWRPVPDGAGDAFTLLTTDPGPDVEPIHDRQMVILDRDDWLAWLDLTRPEAELLRALPAWSLNVETGPVTGRGVAGRCGGRCRPCCGWVAQEAGESAIVAVWRLHPLFRVPPCA
jgi:hypothetical protein